MQLPRAADISVCFSCAKGWDGYPLTQPLKGGIGFRCFCCDKHCYGVRYQLAEDGRMATTWVPEEVRPEDTSGIPCLGAWLAVLQLDSFLDKAGKRIGRCTRKRGPECVPKRRGITKAP
ncbi:unnamed protein product [Symbiodinium microadriaticum]|nr:unnamed protein product [Symbiodinium microadriaticum]CAE7370261.1 unnamed protein product [Symbiodinium sp. KB8]